MLIVDVHVHGHGHGHGHGNGHGHGQRPGHGHRHGHGHVNGHGQGRGQGLEHACGYGHGHVIMYYYMLLFLSILTKILMENLVTMCLKETFLQFMFTWKWYGSIGLVKA
jgi:hypothetical protein